MRKINYLAIGLFAILLSCSKEPIQPTTPIVTPIQTDKKDCEINHTGTLKVSNTTSKIFYVYIEGIYVLTSKPNTITNYDKVPASSGLEVKAIESIDAIDVRKITMLFSDCMVTEISIK